VSDAVRDVAILRIDPKALGSIPAVPLGCALPPRPPLASGQEIFTISTPFRDQKGMSSGTVDRLGAQSVVSDFMLASGSTGGPVFGTDGGLVGLTSVLDEKDESRHGDSRVVLIDATCNVLAAAEKKLGAAPPASGTHLPVEPVQPFPMDALKDAATRRAGNLKSYQTSSSDFDITFITPVLVYGAQHQSEQASSSDRSRGMRPAEADQALVRPLADFSNWSDYVEDLPSVLLVRITPRLVENFWTTVARGAAQTQGVSLPPIKHFKSGFSRMRAFCGVAEVTPIHPFKLEQRVSETDAIYEGLYVFDPGSLGPSCGTVKLVLYSEKEPDKGDTRMIDAKVLQQIWQDFTAYRAVK
jgi:hypothetical protein